MRRYLMGSPGQPETIVTSGTYLYVALQAVAGKLTLGDLTFYTQAVGSVQSSFGSILDGLSGMYENNLYLTTCTTSWTTSRPSKAANARKLGGPASSNGKEGRQRARQAAPLRRVRRVAGRGKQRPYARGSSSAVSRSPTPASLSLLCERQLHHPARRGGGPGRPERAGKTTIVKLLTRLYDPDEGQVLLDGHDIREYTWMPAGRHRRYLPGLPLPTISPRVINIGVGRLEEMENLALWSSRRPRAVADGVIRKLPRGYDTTLGRWFDEGYQFRGASGRRCPGRAFMRDAEILVARRAPPAWTPVPSTKSSPA